MGPIEVEKENSWKCLSQGSIISRTHSVHGVEYNSNLYCYEELHHFTRKRCVHA